VPDAPLDLSAGEPFAADSFSWQYIPDPAGSPDETLCTSGVQGSTETGSDVLGLGGLEQLYGFTLSNRTEVTFDACTADFDTILSVYELGASLFGPDAAPLVYRDDGGCGDSVAFTRTRLTAVLDPGCYALVVEGYGTEQGIFNVQISCNANLTAPASANSAIACNDTVVGDNSDGGPLPQSPVANKADVYVFNVSTDNQPISFDACHSFFDVVLKIYDASLATEILVLDDGGCDVGNITQATRPLLQTTELLQGTYHLVIEGWAGTTGRYVIEMACGEEAEITTTPPPGNPDRGSISCGLSQSNSTISGSDTLGSGSREVFYEFALQRPTRVTLSTCIADFDTYLRIFNGTLGVPTNLTQQIISRDDGGCGSEVVSTRTALTHELPAGRYYIVVEGYLGNQGSFVLNMTCETIESIPNWTQNVSCGTQLTGDIIILANHTSSTQSIGHIEVQTGQYVEFDGCLSDPHLDIVFAQTQQPIGGDANLGECYPDQSAGSLIGMPGFFRRAEFPFPGMYNVSVVGTLPTTTATDTRLSYVIEISCGVLDSPSSGALACNSTVSNTTVGASSVIGQASAERVYTLRVDTPRSYTLSTCNGTDFDTYLHIYTADLLTEVASRDDGGCPNDRLATSLTYTLDAGDYVIAVEGFQGNEGNFTLEVSCGPPSYNRGNFRGEIFCGQLVSGTTEEGFGGDLGVATPQHTYLFVVTQEFSAQPITLDACDSQFDTILTISNSTWNATADDAGCEEGSYASAIHNLHLSPGNYTVTIDGYVDPNGFFYATGPYFLSLSCNDVEVIPSVPTAPTAPTAMPPTDPVNEPTAPTAGAASPTAPVSAPTHIDPAPTVAPISGNAVTSAPSRPSRAPIVAGRPTAPPARSPTAFNTSGTTGGSSGSSGGSSSAVVVVVVLVLLVVLVGGYFGWRKRQNSAAHQFAKMSHNPAYSPNRLLDYEEDVDEDVFARARKGKSPGLGDDW